MQYNYQNLRTIFKKLLQSFSVIFLFTASLSATAINYVPIIMGNIVTFVPYSHVKVTLGSDMLIEMGQDSIVTVNVTHPEDVVSYEWLEGNRLLGTDATLSTEGLDEGIHTIVLTITDINGLSVSDEIIIVKEGYTYLAKKYITENVFEISVPFHVIEDFTPLSSPDYQSMVTFLEDDTMIAVIDCSLFNADYIVEDYGIFFSNVNRTIIPDLQCLYTGVEDNFEQALYRGIYFGRAVDDENLLISNFDSNYELLPNFDAISNIYDFNLTKFEEDLYDEPFVDSPLMNSLLKIKSGKDFFNITTNKYFLLQNTPNIEIENQKIYIDLLDATFNADIEVIDATHIKFSNIQRVNKSDVQYATNTDNNYSDSIFADKIEAFLNETIVVQIKTTDYQYISLIGIEIKFVGSM